MTLLNSIILGLVQGVAEFLPISSSGHLAILQNLFHMNAAGENDQFFDVLLHIATLISVCIVYRRDIADMILAVPGLFRTLAHPKEQPKPAGRLIIMIILGTLPLFIVMPFRHYVEGFANNTYIIAAALIVTGVLLTVSDKIVSGRKNEKTVRVRDALFIGLCQAIATVPGLSRSGTTITGGTMTGLDREFAVKFSFLLSLPAIIGALLLTLLDALKIGIDLSLLPMYLAGMAVAGVTGYFAIGFLRRLAKKGRFGGFAYYCWALAILTIVLSLIF